MRYWVYKCNNKPQSYAIASGDWEEVFDNGIETRWGGTYLKGVENIRVGDKLIACQTNKHSLVGLATVTDIKSDGEWDSFYIRPDERIGAKLPALKKSNKRIGAIKALQGGVIATAYDIRSSDARLLLGAARKAAKLKQKNFAKHRTNKLSTELSELPERVRARVLREVQIAVRNASMRAAVLAVWPAECAACGLDLSDKEGNSECEVAHVHDVFEGGKDLVENAIPLCRTHHWAYDRHLWCISPTTLKIHVRSVNKTLKKLQGKKIKRPKPHGDIKPLAKPHLLWRWKKYLSKS